MRKGSTAEARQFEQGVTVAGLIRIYTIDHLHPRNGEACGEIGIYPIPSNRGSSFGPIACHRARGCPPKGSGCFRKTFSAASEIQR